MPMRSMLAGKSAWARLWRSAVVGAVLGFLSIAVHALDNPESPDRVAAFERRAAPFAQALDKTDGGSASAQAGKRYADFLQVELQSAFEALRRHLHGPALQALLKSQRDWLKFNEAERSFIDRQWTTARQGSSAQLSVALCRVALLKQRTVQLLQYGLEFP